MSLQTRITSFALGAATVLATTVVGHYEGKELEAYRDVVGVPTICFGHTEGVHIGQTLTNEQCDELLKQDLGSAFEVVDRYTSVSLTIERRAALASFVFNVGEQAYRQSTLLRKLNAGETKAACAELSRWVYAKGQKYQGLVARRKTERELCEVGL